MRHPSRSQVVVLSLLTLALAPLAASAQGSIGGQVSYVGDPGGGTQIQVAAHVDMGSPPVATTYTPIPGGPYQLNVPDGTYYVTAIMSRDGVFGEPRPEDDLVWYDQNADGSPDTVTVSGGPTNGHGIAMGHVYVDVDAVGMGIGTSWTDAYTDLQAAINSAVSGYEIWVAEGTYVPGTNRTDSFVPKPGVRVYGGFAGTETTRWQRNWNAHPTILSGEIGSPATTGDNCYNVVNAGTASPTAMLDGVTITAGRADGTAPFDHGAGVQARGGGVTLANATVTGNYASYYGGGVAALLGGTVNAYNTTFSNNQVSYFHGGGYYGSLASVQPQTLVNCVFTGNSAFRGGGIALESAGLLPTLANLSLSDNIASDGASVFTDSSQSIVFSNSIFWDTTPANPMILNWATAPTVNYSIVQGGWGTGTHVLDVNPSFADGELRLSLDSPAIDAGDNTAVPMDLHDVDGDHWTDGPIHCDRDFNPRFTEIPSIPNTGVADPGDSPVDMGAYEAFDASLIFWDGFESGDPDAWSSSTG